ncbi:MAG: acyl-CoA dehydratase activase-related protein, partial [Oscillospiraceae bacterium]
KGMNETATLSPLFNDALEYEEFKQRHKNASVKFVDVDTYNKDAFLGIDCGSTTTKIVLISENGDILYSFYGSNKGNPVDIVKEKLVDMYNKTKANIKGSAVTGYGEDLIKNAFHIDDGIVETMAHFKAAKHFNPNVSFIIDIGGQDIKCFKIKNNSIDSIMLNEACSSGCGSFIETFAKSMGKSIEEFASIGLFAKHPADLGSRCTVFMNSSVKQAQKDGAGVDDISAGLSISVVKNALYKVIRVVDADELGKNIVVQGGTFYNDAILKSFECEIGRNVIRPNIAGLMGAYGAALHAKALNIQKSDLLDKNQLEKFTHKSSNINCNGCANHCNLTVNTFNDNSKYISGNKCEKPLGISSTKAIPNIYEYKRNRISKLKAEGEFKRGCVGLPLGLAMYENAPFWFNFFKAIDVKPVFSDFSTTNTYNIGRYSIPSDTACYPAKLMHGHIEELLAKGITNIFYPSLTYNFDEGKGDNYYNCPIVAYYSELLKRNIPALDKANFMYPYFGLHRRNDFVKFAYKYFKDIYKDITKEEIKKASDIAYKAYYDWQIDLQEQGEKALQYAKENSLLTVVLAGRPYHIDPEINHGIDKLINSLNIVVISEDC